MRIKRSPFKPRAKLLVPKVENKKKAAEATVYIYDEIGWFGVTAEDFVKDLNALKEDTIHIRLNSPGGTVFDGTAIYNAIKQHKSKIIVHVDGIAASIASVLAMAADEIVMAENAYMMIHDPWSIVIGNAATMREEADLLDKFGGTISQSYAKRTGLEEGAVDELMANETWMTAEEALDMGFADKLEEVDEEDDRKNLFDLSVFANVPDQLIESKKTPTARDLERILRDAGCTKKQAKAILSEGWVDDRRDDDAEPATPPVETPQRDVEAQPYDKDRTLELIVASKMLRTGSAN